MTRRYTPRRRRSTPRRRRSTPRRRRSTNKGRMDHGGAAKSDLEERISAHARRKLSEAGYDPEKFIKCNEWINPNKTLRRGLQLSVGSKTKIEEMSELLMKHYTNWEYFPQHLKGMVAIRIKYFLGDQLSKLSSRICEDLNGYFYFPSNEVIRAYNKFIDEFIKSDGADAADAGDAADAAYGGADRSGEARDRSSRQTPPSGAR